MLEDDERRAPGVRERRRRAQVEPINPQLIMQACGFWKWAEIAELDRVSLRKMGRMYLWKETGEFADTFYEEIASIPILL